MTFSFSFVAFDQVVNNAPNMLTMSGGQFNIPIVFRGPNGPAHQLGATHSHATEPLFANFPGLKIAIPGTPRDAKGLLKTAIRDDNPVLVLESELLYNVTGPIEDKEVELLIPLGKGEIKREGADVTIICYAQTVRMALAAAETLGRTRCSGRGARPSLHQAIGLGFDSQFGVEDAPLCDRRTGQAFLRYWRQS